MRKHSIRAVALGAALPLVVLFGTGMLLIMWGGTLVSWWIALGVVVSFVPALLCMRFVTSKDDLALALEEADRELDPPVPVRVRWGGEWHTPALLHGWKQSEDRGDGWLGCVEYHREIAPGFGFAVGRWTPAWNIERTEDEALPF